MAATLAEFGPLLSAAITSVEQTHVPRPGTPGAPGPSAAASATISSSLSTKGLFELLSSLSAYLKSPTPTVEADVKASGRELRPVFDKLLKSSSASGNATATTGLPSPSSSSSSGPFGSGPSTPGGSLPGQSSGSSVLAITPIRKLFVECLISLYVRCDKLDVYGFIRDMCDFASQSAAKSRAGPGPRLTALELLGEVFAQPAILKRAAGLVPEALSAVGRAARSADPGIREGAGLCGASVCNALAAKAYESKPFAAHDAFTAEGLEERDCVEIVKTSRRLAEDRVPEVRVSAAKLCAAAAPLAALAKKNSKEVLSGKDTQPLILLDELLTVSLQNLDDENVAAGLDFADACARAVCAAIDCTRMFAANASVQNAKRDIEDDEKKSTSATAPPPAPTHMSSSSNMSFASSSSQRSSPSSITAAAAASAAAAAAAAAAYMTTPSDTGMKSMMSKLNLGASKTTSPSVAACTSTHTAIYYLGAWFVRVGGETGLGTGGAFGLGGRATRKMIAVVMSKILSLQSSNGSLLKSGSSLKDILVAILNTLSTANFPPVQNVGPQSTFGSPGGVPSSPSSANITAAVNNKTDVAMARVAIAHVLRSGLGSTITEPMQLTLINELTNMISSSDGAPSELNSNQQQICLVELSHLITALNEGSSTILPQLIPTLTTCLGHRDHGVRFEAATTLASIVAVFPQKCFEFIHKSIGEVKKCHSFVVVDQPSSANDGNNAHYLEGLHKIHGNSMAIAMLLHELGSELLPRYGDRIHKETKALYHEVLAISEQLTARQFDGSCRSDGLMSVCVRAGFTCISALLTLGPTYSKKHFAALVAMWQKSVDGATKSGQKSANNSRGDNVAHELNCLDAALCSILSFVRNCPELLLVVPDALTRVVILLEGALSVVYGKGKLANPSSILAVSRLDTIKACLMEAFCWLPPGSYPMVAEDLFFWAAEHIKIGCDGDIQSSLLKALVSRDDSILDVKSYSGAKKIDDVGEDELLVGIFAFKSSIPLEYGEREALLHVTERTKRRFKAYVTPSSAGRERRYSNAGSSDDRRPPPTPMHAVGNWKEPPIPFGSSSVRLMDASIHMFSALFGLQDGHSQLNAASMLMNLIPTSLTQPKQAASMFDKMLPSNEVDRAAKARLHGRLSVNIATATLCFLQALPVHEGASSSDMAWVPRTREILTTLLPSPLSNVRRAAAEGLGLLVSRLRGSVINETIAELQLVAEGLYSNGRPRKDPSAAFLAKSGAVLALSCIGKYPSSLPAGMNSKLIELVMSKCNGREDSNLVKSWTLYSVGVLLDHLEPETSSAAIKKQIQVLSDVVFMVETRFLVDWDLDQGNGVAATVRLVNILLPIFFELDPVSECIGSLARIIEIAKTYQHATVLHECLKFSEVMTNFSASKLNAAESIPFFAAVLNSNVAPVVSGRRINCFGSPTVLRTSVACIRGLINSMPSADVQKLQLHSEFLLLLESCAGKNKWAQGEYYRGLAVGREVEIMKKNVQYIVERELRAALDVVLKLDGRFLHLFLFSMCVIRGEAGGADEETLPHQDEDDEGHHAEGGGSSAAAASKTAVFTPHNRQTVVKAARRAAKNEASAVTSQSSRWQVRLQATLMATGALLEIDDSIKHNFDGKEARAVVTKECNLANAAKNANPPSSFAALHVEDIVAAACSASTSGDDLIVLQTAGLGLLKIAVQKFIKIMDPDVSGSDVSILSTLSSAITSSLKPSLAGALPGFASAYMKSGGEALRALSPILSTAMLKRMLKPVVASCAVFNEDTRAPGEKYETLLRLALISDLMLSNDLSTEIIGDGAEKSAICVLMAKCAIDGASFLRNEDFEFWAPAPSENWVKLLSTKKGLLNGYIASTSDGDGEECKSILEEGIVKFAACACAGLSPSVLQEDRAWMTVLSSVVMIGTRAAVKRLPTDFAGSRQECELYFRAVDFIATKLGTSAISGSVDAAEAAPEMVAYVNDWVKVCNAIVYALRLLNEKKSHGDDATAVAAVTGLGFKTVSNALKMLVSAEMTSSDNVASVNALAQSSGNLCSQLGLWEVWATLPSPAAFVSSLPSVRAAILDGSAPLKTFSAVPVELVMALAGGEIVATFRKNGCGDVVAFETAKRAQNCADCLRFVLLSSQSATEQSSQEALLALLVPIFVDVISFNGLPQNFRPGTGGAMADPTIGKLCAAAILHFAKSAGAAFKVVMTVADARSKEVLEQACKGEMTAYATSGGMVGAGGTGAGPTLKRFGQK